MYCLLACWLAGLLAGLLADVLYDNGLQYVHRCVEPLVGLLMYSGCWLAGLLACLLLFCMTMDSICSSICGTLGNHVCMEKREIVCLVITF